MLTAGLKGFMYIVSVYSPEDARSSSLEDKYSTVSYVFLIVEEDACLYCAALDLTSRRATSLATF